VNTAISITHLGYYDSNLTSVVETFRDTPVGVYDLSTNTLLTSTTVHASDPANGLFRYVAITPLALNTSDTYAVVGVTGSNYYTVGVQKGTSPVNAAINYLSAASYYSSAGSPGYDTQTKTLVQPNDFSAGNIFGTPTPPTFLCDFGPNFLLTAPGAALPAINAGGVASAATYQAGGVSPGLIVTLFGSAIGPAALAAAAPGTDGKFPTMLAGTQVLFDGIAAPMVYASAGQTSAIVPYEVATKVSTLVTVAYQGATSPAQTMAVVPAQLGLFSANASGQGQGAILNQDNSINSASNPAKRGSIVVLFGTGEGQTTPAGVDGQTAVSVYPKPNTPITVKIGGSDGQVLYYGAAPTLVAGVLQVNVTIPIGIPDGNATVQVFEGASQSPATITVAVKGDQ
jgi:uncharacterized protein (TIGR03437 family)